MINPDVPIEILEMISPSEYSQISELKELDLFLDEFTDDYGKALGGWY